MHFNVANTAWAQGSRLGSKGGHRVPLDIYLTAIPLCCGLRSVSWEGSLRAG